MNMQQAQQLAAEAQALAEYCQQLAHEALVSGDRYRQQRIRRIEVKALERFARRSDAWLCVAWKEKHP